jgi:hypothetical protein
MLMGVGMSNPRSVVLSQTLNARSSDIIQRLEWSPDGCVLAVASLLSGLCFSYDGGKTLVPFERDIRGPDRFVWVSNALLYAHQYRPDGDRILEIEMREGEPRIKRTVASGEVRLCGYLAGNIVYCLKKSIIYCGDTVLHTSTGRLGGVFADGSYVAFLEEELHTKDRHVSILDSEGSRIRQKDLPSDTIVIGVSSERKSVYLLKNLRVIETWEFTENNEISTLYKLW